MAKLTVFDRGGKEVGTYDIEPADLAPRINKQLLHDVVVMYQSNLRQGTAKTKSRARSGRHDQEDVSPEGDRQRPGRLAAQRHPPRRRAHLRQADPRLDLSPAAQGGAAGHADGAGRQDRDDEFMVIDELAFDAPKTKDMAAILKALKLDGDSLLVATAEHDVNVYKSARNIAEVTVSPVSDLNALAMLRRGGCW